MVFVDVGAHIGRWTTTVAETVGDAGKVIAGEPSRTTAGRLREAVAARKIANVVIVQAAASDRVGTAQIYHDPDSTMNSLAVSSGTCESVPMVTLDSCEALQRVDRIDLIKIDTEGNDERVINGAKQLLTRYHPVVVFEVNLRRSRELGLQPDGAWAAMAEQGYQLYRLDRWHRPVRVGQFAPCPDDGNSWNVIAF